MKPHRTLIICMVALAGLAGCATKPGSTALESDKAGQQVATEAPLGSRVKRPSSGGVSEAMRQDREQARTQAGAAQVGAVQRGR